MIQSATIYLGSKCNLNCAYCHRQADKNENGVTENLLNLLREKKPQEIRFFGGEPTLYMDDIKKVVAACPWVKHFVVTTNGVLLDRYIEYFRRHGFQIVLSCDAGEENLRGYDPLTKALRYPKVSVSTTLYHGNTDFGKIFKNFAKAEEATKRTLLFFPHIAHHTNEKNREYSLTLDDVENLLGEYRYGVGKFLKDFGLGVVNMRYMGIVAALLRSRKAGYEFGETYCINKRRLKVNADGEEFNCLYIRNVPAEKNKEYMRLSYPQCAKCEYYHMCGGACVQSLSHEIECKFYHGLFEFFDGLLKKIPEEKIARIERVLGC